MKMMFLKTCSNGMPRSESASTRPSATGNDQRGVTQMMVFQNGGGKLGWLISWA